MDDGGLPIVCGHVLTADDRRRGAAIARLMCNAELPRALWVDDEGTLAARLAPLVEDGLVVLGRAFLCPVCAFYAGTFEQLLRALVWPQATVREVECEATGGRFCRFVVEPAPARGRPNG